jgi:hypothetical protein
MEIFLGGLSIGSAVRFEAKNKPNKLAEWSCDDRPLMKQRFEIALTLSTCGIKNKTK